MGCTRIDEDLLGVVEGHASAELVAHVIGCDDCRDAKHAAARAAAVVTRAGDDWHVTADLVSAIEARGASADGRSSHVRASSGALAPAADCSDARARRARWGIKRALTGVVVVAAICAGIGVKMGTDGRKDPRVLAPRAWHGKIGKIVRAGADSSGGLRARRPDGADVPLSEGQEVNAGWHVITDPRTRARVEFDDGSVIALDHATELVLDDSPRTAILQEGSVVADIARIDEAPGARLLAPLGSVEVLGTRLALTATPDRTSVEVLRGTVSVTDGAGGRAQVSAGQEAVVSRGAPIEVTPANDLAQRTAFDVGLGESRASGEDGEGAVSGLGELRAKKPGSTMERDRAVHLSSHAAKIRVAGNVARTEVDEVFTNDTDDVLEGIFRFPLPPGAQIERLALEVDGKLVEGEFVDKAKAAAIWRGAIQNAAPRVPPPHEEIIWVPGPWRDPALLEWQRGGRFELRVFPIPKRGSRRIVMAYTETVAPMSGVRRFTYPLPQSTASDIKIDAFSIDAQILGADPDRPIRVRGYELARSTPSGNDNGAGGARFSLTTTGFVPSGDLTLEYALADRAADASVFAFAEPMAQDPDAFVAIALRPKLPRWTDVRPRDQVIVVDAGRAMFGERMNRARRLAVQMVQEMDRRDRVTVLTCDVACRALPRGWLAPGSGAAHEVDSFLAGSAPDGATDLVGAVRAAGAVNGRDLARDLRLVLVSSGHASAGYQRLDRIAAEVGSVLPDARAEIVTVPVGQDADLALLQEIARGGGGVVVPYQPGERVETAAIQVLNATYGTTLRDVELTLPPGLHDAAPRAHAPIRAGEERIVVARASGEPRGDIVLKGKVGGESFEAKYPIEVRVTRGAGNAFVPRLYAEVKIADLEREVGERTRSEIVALSRRHAVPSRFTSLLVLESEAMFQAFGIDRAARSATWTGDALATSTDVAAPVPLDSARAGDAFGGLLDSASGMGMGSASAAFAPTPTVLPHAKTAVDDESRSPPAPRAAPEARAPARRPPVDWPRPRGGRFMKRVWSRSASITAGATPVVAPERIAAARAALAAAPDERSKYKELASVLAENGQLDELGDVLAKWATRDPLDADGIAARADLLARQGDRDSALRVLSGVLASSALPWRDAGRLASTIAAAHERAGNTEACAFRIAAAELLPADPDAVARAMICERDRGRGAAAARWLDGRHDAARAAVNTAVAKLEQTSSKAESASSGDVVASASWSAGAEADVDISIIEPNGTRAAWCSGAAAIRVADATSTTREALALTTSITGPYVIELVRGRGAGSVTGSLIVRALGTARTIPFTLPAGATRVQIARVDVRMDSQLVPVDDLPDRAIVRGAPPFEASAAANALGMAALRVRSCSEENGPIGSGTARVVFGAAGAVSRVELDPRFEGTPTGACVARHFGAVRVAPFSGGNVTIVRPFTIEAF